MGTAEDCRLSRRFGDESGGAALQLSSDLRKKQVLHRAETVHLSFGLRPLRLDLNEKQIPRFVENK
jgi:hypothetical protein